MKMMNKFAFASAAVLAGAMSFSSCSSSDDIAGGGDYTTGEAVKTQFSISIPQAALKGGKMTGQITQQTGNFRGMDNIYLFPFKSDVTSGLAFDGVVIPLGSIAESDLTASQSSKIYSNVNVPVNTTHFLFYGTAIKETSTGNNDPEFVNGTLKTTLGDATVANTNDITFELLPCFKESTNDPLQTEKADLQSYLNTVAGTADWSSSSDADLQKLYKNFTTMLHAGSGPAILATMENLYNALYVISQRTGSEATIASAIIDNIKEKMDVTTVLSGNKYPVTWNSGNTKYENFPTNYNLPEGAVCLKFENSAFAYVDNPTVGTSNTIDMTKLCYPADLRYFVNTDLRASDVVPITWPRTVADWTNEQWTNWNTAVQLTTHAVALKENIQYGVARLETKVACKSALLADNASSFNKNDQGQPTVQDNQVAVKAEGFPVSAVFIGGQPTASQWDFLPTTTATMDNVVYDKVMNSTVAAKYNVDGGVNYTLVMDNNCTPDQEKVNIAVEFTNNTDVDFYGKDGIIPAGGKFYLVAQLVPSTSPTDPNVNRVFIQDYTTKANLTIANLKNAYQTIPDLRASKLELGLSVDLEWKAGLEFNVDFE